MVLFGHLMLEEHQGFPLTHPVSSSAAVNPLVTNPKMFAVFIPFFSNHLKTFTLLGQVSGLPFVPPRFPNYVHGLGVSKTRLRKMRYK